MKHAKLAACAALAVLLLLASACSSSDDVSADTKNVPLATLQQTMLEADTTLPDMTIVSSREDDAQTNFLYLSDISYDLVEEYFYASATAGTAEEIAVIQLKDAGSAGAVMESLHEHIADRQGTFREYDPEQIPLTEEAVITREGRYVTLIVCQKNGLVQNAFRAAFQ